MFYILNNWFTSTCKTCLLHLRNISKIRYSWSLAGTEKLVYALTTSKIDNANLLLYGLPKFLIDRLQIVQNVAAKLSRILLVPGSLIISSLFQRSYTGFQSVRALITRYLLLTDKGKFIWYDKGVRGWRYWAGAPKTFRYPKGELW